MCRVLDQPADHLGNLLAPLVLIEPHIKQLWKARLTDKDIVQELQKHIDMNQCGIGLTTFVKIHNGLGLHCTHQQKHTLESIFEAIVKLQAMYPKAGAHEMISLLFHERDMAVSSHHIQQYFATCEPELVQQCKAGHLQHHHFWAAGVNNIWVVDQHNKWLCFRLALHTGVEPFSGQILWMRVWHSNCNLQLILSYYLSTVEKLGFIPLVTQSDPGTEIFRIPNTQTLLCQMHDPALAGYIQHHWMQKKKNVMPKIAWSQLHQHFTPGSESLLEQGTEEGWFNINNTLQL
ncbi:hypothetical protein PAXRUDRAFT_143761 [Paxillus rubicundulus Ve08.2h10]|uniref:Uncharacterized protein n=1 Tax=Paxillus rubicundulus Ve08.2h10 TaxID=930991 RepID=A0A0D0E7I8_9AGAM|nr:hypothetical protein PAXRUDRAFT_143761 [Paxillus rubicundulus Ve08.2h10]